MLDTSYKNLKKLLLVAHFDYQHECLTVSLQRTANQLASVFSAMSHTSNEVTLEAVIPILV